MLKTLVLSMLLGALFVGSTSALAESPQGVEGSIGECTISNHPLPTCCPLEVPYYASHPWDISQGCPPK